MPGNKEGGIKARDTNIRLHGKDFYREMGRKGGAAKVPKGFALMDKKAHQLASKKGGKISRKPSMKASDFVEVPTQRHEKWFERIFHNKEKK